MATLGGKHDQRKKPEHRVESEFIHNLTSRRRLPADRSGPRTARTGRKFNGRNSKGELPLGQPVSKKGKKRERAEEKAELTWTSDREREGERERTIKYQLPRGRN